MREGSPAVRASSCVAVLVAIVATGCSESVVSLGTTYALDVRVNSLGGDFPASYSVRLEGPFEESSHIGCDTDELPGFGAVSRDVPVPPGSLAPFDVNTRFEDVGEGCYALFLPKEGRPPNCSTYPYLEFKLLADDSKILSVTCHENRLAVTVVSTGDRSDIPDSYTVAVDGEQSLTLAMPPSSPYSVVETVSYLVRGYHTVVLTAPPDNCSVTPGLSITDLVDDDQTTSVEFVVDCASPEPGILTGTILDTDGLTPLPDMGVYVSRAGSATVTDSTDVSGRYIVEVDAGSGYSVSSAAVIGSRWLSTSPDTTAVAASDTTTVDQDVSSGPHLDVSGETIGSVVATAGDSVSVSVPFQFWNRRGCPACVLSVAIGVDGTALDVYRLGAPAGLYPGTSGNADFRFEAPPGGGKLYVFLVRVSTATDIQPGLDRYEEIWSDGLASLYFIEIGDLVIS